MNGWATSRDGSAFGQLLCHFEYGAHECWVVANASSVDNLAKVCGKLWVHNAINGPANCLQDFWLDLATCAQFGIGKNVLAPTLTH